MSPFFGEFMGTMMLLIFGNGVVANANLKESKAKGAGWVNITLGWAVGVMVGVFTAIACGAPQADINPAVTLAKALNGVYTMSQAIMTMLAQLAGGFSGAIFTWLVFLPHWAVTTGPDSQGIKLGVFATGPALRNYPANLISEILGTFVLVFGIFAINAEAVGGLAPGLGPYLVAMLVWGIGVCLGGPTGYAINPARDLGPRIAHAILPIPGKGDSDWDYSWVPVIGPLIGAAIAAWICIGIGLI